MFVTNENIQKRSTHSIFSRPKYHNKYQKLTFETILGNVVMAQVSESQSKVKYILIEDQRRIYKLSRNVHFESNVPNLFYFLFYDSFWNAFKRSPAEVKKGKKKQ